MKKIKVRKPENTDQLWQEFLTGPIAVAKSKTESMMPEDKRIDVVKRKYSNRYTFVAFDENAEQQGLVLAHQEFFRIVIDKLEVHSKYNGYRISEALLNVVEKSAFGKNHKFNDLPAEYIRVEPTEKTTAMLRNAGYKYVNTREGSVRMEKAISANGTFHVVKVTDRMRHAFEALYSMQESTKGYAKMLQNSIENGDTIAFVRFHNNKPVGIVAGNIETVDMGENEITQATLYDLYSIGVNDYEKQVINKSLVKKFSRYAAGKGVTRIEVIDVPEHIKDFNKFRALGFGLINNQIIKSL